MPKKQCLWYNNKLYNKEILSRRNGEDGYLNFCYRLYNKEIY